MGLKFSTSRTRGIPGNVERRWPLTILLIGTFCLCGASGRLLAQEVTGRSVVLFDDVERDGEAAETERFRMPESFDVESMFEPSGEREFEVPLKALYKDGFGLHSEDDQFQLRLKFLTQIDGKAFTPTDQEPARGGMYVPRFRTYFEGQLRDGYEYELSLQRSVEGAFDLLDANVNFAPSEEFQIRVGRSLTPYSYTWYDHLEQFYITPERGLVPLNFGLARQVGVIFHGKFGEKFEYAAGPTFGHLAGLADRNTTREGVGYINYRPFVDDSDDYFFKYLNIGGSLALGRTPYATEALPLRTSIQTSENDEAAQAASTQFLEFNPDMQWVGGRQQGALHVANYSGPLSIEAEVYALSFQARADEHSAAVWLPILGYDVTASWFLTGESVTGRGVIEPLAPLGEGFGAWEIFGRYSDINISEKVFTAGLADEADWTRHVGMTDIGFNWYLNRFVKMTFDWQHAMFGSPILLNEAKDKRGSNTDLFWMRCQLYF
ncbi:OprO/OprP family phosphate-selective porin [Thalassoglobus sp.]|uniref:OprO/OprP family phosphate-selective porin n=1 Tax=Thalassoglobus sp. TaxID=2795869 RepID=UPI003AA7E785